MRNVTCIVTHMSTNRRGLTVLALCAFIFVSCELFPVSALLEISGDLGVHPSTAGLLLSGYAGVVALTAWPATRLTAGWDRRTALAATIAVLAVTSLASAAATDFWMLATLRVAMALGHGLFWSAIGSSAARLVPAGRQGLATATVFSGNAAALVAGVPLLNAVSHAIGWRAATAGAGLIAAVAAVALLRVLPAMPTTVGSIDAPRGRAGLPWPALISICLSTLTLVAAYFATYTYVTPILVTAGITGGLQAASLAGFGILGLLGIATTARHIDTRPLATPLVQACVTTLAFAAAITHHVPAVIWIGLLTLGYSGLAVSWQGNILKAAGARADEASAIYVTAFQIGIAAGPVLGGLLQATSMQSVYWGSLILAALGVVTTSQGARHSS